MIKNIKLLTAGLLLTLCVGVASCGGGNSSSGSSTSPSGSSSPSTSGSTSSSVVTLESPNIVQFFSDVQTAENKVEYGLTWDYVKQANGYLVSVNGEEIIEVEGNECFITEYVTVGEENLITVQAKGDGIFYADSLPTEGLYTPKPVVSGFSYSGEILYGLKNAEDYPEEVYIPNRYDGRTITQIDLRDDSGHPGTKVKKIWIPKSIEHIGREAFYNFTGLEEFTIEEGTNLKFIGERAFYNCAIERIELPATVKEIDAGAFGGKKVKEIVVDENNPYFCTIDGNLYSKDKKTFVQYAGGKTEEEFTVPNFVETVRGGAFYDCASLKKIVFSNSVKSFEFAFDILVILICDELTEVVVSNAMSEIIDLCAGCSKLKQIDFPEGVILLGRRTVDFLESVVLPKSILCMNTYPNNEVFTVYYKGNAQEWEKVELSESWYTRDVTVYFYSEDEPDGEGNFWHYNSAGEIEVWE